MLLRKGSVMTKVSRARLAATTTALAATASIAVFGGAAWADSSPFLPGPGGVSTIASTVPKNGDINPYGIAVVPASVGKLHRGNVLISNFNAKSNLQGTGPHDRADQPQWARGRCSPRSLGMSV